MVVYFEKFTIKLFSNGTSNDDMFHTQMLLRFLNILMILRQLLSIIFFLFNLVHIKNLVLGKKSSRLLTRCLTIDGFCYN